jgi:hypothetical protein
LRQGEALKEFHFRAPTLFEASATPTAEEEAALHDALCAAEPLARIRKFAFWLKSAMVAKGLDARGPNLAEGGWDISIPTGGGPFVHCSVSGSRDDASLFELLVVEIGGAPKDVCDVIERLLRSASEITELTVD